MNFYIKTGMENMQILVVGELLRTTYWANERSDELIETTRRNYTACYKK